MSGFTINDHRQSFALIENREFLISANVIRKKKKKKEKEGKERWGRRGSNSKLKMRWKIMYG